MDCVLRKPDIFLLHNSQPASAVGRVVGGYMPIHSSGSSNLTLNPDKMQFRLPKVSFFGHTWSDKGLSANQKKIEAVNRMELPWDVETMRSFLRLINYLNWSSPCLAELSNPLRKICRQTMEFKVYTACEVTFQCCKEEISKNIMLPYYNFKAFMILQTDASKRGLGNVLLQNPTPMMFASRALSGSERNYQNLERECLASIARNLHQRQIRSH